jgi:hypothetical protein
MASKQGPDEISWSGQVHRMAMAACERAEGIRGWRDARDHTNHWGEKASASGKRPLTAEAEHPAQGQGCARLSPAARFPFPTSLCFLCHPIFPLQAVLFRVSCSSAPRHCCPACAGTSSAVGGWSDLQGHIGHFGRALSLRLLPAWPGFPKLTKRRLSYCCSTSTMLHHLSHLQSLGLDALLI